jgi:hypothetical protein
VPISEDMTQKLSLIDAASVQIAAISRLHAGTRTKGTLFPHIPVSRNFSERSGDFFPRTTRILQFSSEMQQT